MSDIKNLEYKYKGKTFTYDRLDRIAKQNDYSTEDLIKSFMSKGMEAVNVEEELSDAEQFNNIFSNASLTLQNAWNSTQLASVDFANYLGIVDDDYADNFIEKEYAQIEAINKKYKDTGKGIIGGLQEGDFMDVALGVTNALTSVVTTVVPAVVTRGVSLIPQIMAPMYTEYNSEKAKSLYGDENIEESIRKLRENEEDEVIIPFALGATAVALEKIGIKGIGKYVVNQAKNKASRRIAELALTGNREGLTEYFQGGLNAANKAAARGEDVNEAVYNHLTSKEALEEYLQGFVGGTGVSAGGRAINNVIRSDQDNLIINEYIQKIGSLQQQKINLKTPEAKTAIDKKIKKAEEDFKSFLINNQERSKFITEEQSKELVSILDVKNDLNKKLVNFENQFKSGEINQNEFNSIVEDINNDINAENKKAEDIRIEANKKFIMDDLRISSTAINKILGLVQKTYKTKQEFLDSYNAKTGKNLTLNDIEGVDGVKIGNEIMINVEEAAKNNAVTVGSHELLHGILKSSLTGSKRTLGKDANGNIIETDLTVEGEQLIDDFLKTLNAKEKKVVQKRIDDNYKFNKDGSEKQFAEYAEEYLNAYADAAIKNELTDSVLVKIGKFLSKIFNRGDRGYKNLQFKTGQDVKAFLKAYVSDRKKGEFRQQFVEMAQEGVKQESTVEKKSLSAAAREQITESVKEIGSTYSFEGGKKSWDEGGADNAITEIKQNNYLDDLIAAKFKGDRVPVDFVDKVYTELTNHIRNFNPETNDNLFGWINSQLANKAGNVFNREYKTTTEQRTARDVDDRTKEGEIKTQVADETDVTLEALETQDISPQAEARRKRQAAEKAEPTKSKLRQEMGIEDGSDAYNTVLDTARKVLIRAYDAGKTARQIQRDLTKEASTYLFKQVKNMLGTKAKYIPTIKKFRVPLIKSMFTADLVQMERNVPDNERVFTKFVKKLTSKKEVQDAVNDNFLPPSALNTIDKGQSVSLYEKVMPTEEQFVAFFDQPLVNPKTGLRSGLRGTRKDQLAKYVAASLNYDATMQVAQEPEILQKRKDIADLKGDVLMSDDLQVLASTINRDINLKFSISSIDEVNVSNKYLNKLKRDSNFETKEEALSYIKNQYTGENIDKNELEQSSSIIYDIVTEIYNKRYFEDSGDVKSPALLQELIKRYKKLKSKKEENIPPVYKMYEQIHLDILNQAIKDLDLDVKVNESVTEVDGANDIMITNIRGDVYSVEIKMDQARTVSETLNFKIINGKIVWESTKQELEIAKDSYDSIKDDLAKTLEKIIKLSKDPITNSSDGISARDYENIDIKRLLSNFWTESAKPLTTEAVVKRMVDKGNGGINIGESGFFLFENTGNEFIDKINTEVKNYIKRKHKIDVPYFKGDFKLYSQNNTSKNPKTKKNVGKHTTNVRLMSRIDNKVIGQSDLNLSKTKDAKIFAEAVDYVMKFSKSQNVSNIENIIFKARSPLKYSKTSRGMSAFDFDETLIDKGENFILATSPDGDQIRISSGQWPIKGPELTDLGYTFDFKDFVNVRGGVDGPLLQKLKNRIKKYGAKNNYILTARPAESATAIHGWLKTKGINIPLENITGLGNSTGEAKAMWIAGKYSEGYNDIYFVDDALPNVEAVQNVLNQLDVKGKSVQAKIKFSKSIKNTLNKNKSYIKFKNSLKNSVFYHGGLNSLKNKNAVWFIVDDVIGAEVYSDIRGVIDEVYSVKASQLKDSIIIPDVNDSFGFDKIIKQKFPDQVKVLVDDGQVKIDKILKQDNAAEIISEYINWADSNFELFEGVYGPETLYDNSGKIAKSLPVIVLDTDVSSKAKEVKPSTKFSKSSLRGNKTVKNVFDQLDIKGKSVQAKINFSKSLDKEFNDIIEDVKSIDSKKRFSDAKGRARGRGKGRFRFFIPPSHEDFVGLLYNFIGKGAKGNKHRDFFEKALIRPLNRAYRELNVAKQAIANDYRALIKSMPDVRKRLSEKILKSDYTVEDAIRIYLFDKAGFEVPGLTKTDLKNLTNFVKENSDILQFADQVGKISRVEEGYVSPGDSWQGSNIRYDLVDATGRVGRAKFFTEYQENADIIFSDENINKIRAAFGDNFVEALKDMLYVNKTGSNRPTGNHRIVNNFLDWVNGSVGATMFFNARSAVLQTLSTVNFINFGDNNIFKAAAAFSNQKQYWKDFSFLFNSDYLKQRRSGAAFDVNASEIAREVAGSKNPVVAATKYLLNIGFLPTQLADSFAIASGGSTFYRNRVNTYVKQGLSQKEAESKAFIDFQEVAESTQQSARPDMVSQQQRSPLGRVILAFQNVTAQYARIIKKSGLDLVNRRISKGYTNQVQSDTANISRIIYYGAVQAIIFNALQNALFAMMFDEEEEDEEKTKKFFDTKKQRVINGTIDSLLKGMGVGGAVISTVKNYAIKLTDNLENKSFFKTPAWEELLQLSPPIGIKIRKIARAERNLEWNKDVLTELPLDNLDNPIYDISTAYIEGFTNIPVARLLRKVQNLSAALDKENKWWQRVAVAAGWSRWDVGIQDNEIKEIKSAIRENNRRINEETKLKQATPEEKLKIIEKSVFDLNKNEQVKILEANNLNPKKYPKEADRVKAIMNLRKTNERKIDSTIVAIENYVPTKEEQRSIDLFKMNKKDQVNMLIDLGLSSKQIRDLKYEEDRVNKIIQLQDKSKSKK